MVDLHTHTSKSDGTFSPEELVKYAKEKNIKAIAITDHDTVEGLDEAIEAGKKYGVEVVPGIEFSTSFVVDNDAPVSKEHGRCKERDIHVVGLFIDHKSKAFDGSLKTFVDSRIARNEKMCRLLCETYGFDISFEKLQAAFPEAVITRAHYAAYLQDKGYVKSKKEAFDRFVGDHCPCFVPREKITPEDAVRLIHQGGGLAVLAHPVLYGLGKDTLRKLVDNMKGVGLDAIEAVYSTYTPSDERDIKALAEEMGLHISGGSDFHGANKPDIDLGVGRGKLYVHDSVYEELKKLHSND